MTDLYGFQRTPARTLNRIAGTEGLTSRQRRGVGRNMPFVGIPTMMVAKVGGTAIPAATEAAGVRTCGSGTVTLQYANDDDELTDVLDSDGNAATKTVLNWSLEDSGTDTYIWVAMNVYDGRLYYVNEPC